MKILKKYANGGSTKGDGTPRKPIHVRKPKEKGNPFNTGTGSKFRKLANRMKKRQGPAEGRKYMGGGKMKEYGHGGKMKYENGGTMGRAPGGQRDEKQRERMRARLGGGADNPGRGGVKGMDKDRMEEMQKRRRMRKRMRSAKLMKGAGKGAAQMGVRSGVKSMEDGGTNPEKRMTRTVSDLKKKRSREGKRFDKKFSRKRKQYDKDVSKGRTKDAPHERTFKFRKKGDSVFKKRGKFTVETAREKKQRLDSRPVDKVYPRNEERQESRDDKRRRRDMRSIEQRRKG
jgi:hypothetical protein